MNFYNKRHAKLMWFLSFYVRAADISRCCTETGVQRWTAVMQTAGPRHQINAAVCPGPRAALTCKNHFNSITAVMWGICSLVRCFVSLLILLPQLPPAALQHWSRLFANGNCPQFAFLTSLNGSGGGDDADDD